LGLPHEAIPRSKVSQDMWSTVASWGWAPLSVGLCMTCPSYPDQGGSQPSGQMFPGVHSVLAGDAIGVDLRQEGRTKSPDQLLSLK
jgi:hypothetical protein